MSAILIALSEVGEIVFIRFNPRALPVPESFHQRHFKGMGTQALLIGSMLTTFHIVVSDRTCFSRWDG
jgi:hypothetical protein